MRDHRRHWGGVAAAFATLVLGCGAAFANHAADSSAEPAAASTAADAARGTPVTVAGLRVFIDPETGRLRPPTEAEAAALAKAVTAGYADKRTENGPAVHHADGSVSMRLGTRHLLHNMARVDADGDVETFCVQGAEAASRVLAESATTGDADRSTP